MTAETKRRPGRPKLPEDAVKRHNVTLRMRAPVRERLLQAAQENGRSLSEEMEYRIERSFDREAIGLEVFGGLVSGLAEAITAAMIKRRPYTPEEQRVCEYLQEITEGVVESGEDPVGFLIASHNTLRHEVRERRVLDRRTEAIEDHDAHAR